MRREGSTGGRGRPATETSETGTVRQCCRGYLLRLMRVSDVCTFFCALMRVQRLWDRKHLPYLLSQQLHGAMPAARFLKDDS